MTPLVPLRSALSWVGRLLRGVKIQFCICQVRVLASTGPQGQRSLTEARPGCPRGREGGAGFGTDPGSGPFWAHFSTGHSANAGSCCPAGLVPRPHSVTGEAGLAVHPSQASSQAEGLGSPGDTWKLALPGQQVEHAVAQRPAGLRSFLLGLTAGWWPRNTVEGAELGVRLRHGFQASLCSHSEATWTRCFCSLGLGFSFHKTRRLDRSSGVHRMVPGPMVSTSGNLLETHILTPFKTF